MKFSCGTRILGLVPHEAPYCENLFLVIPAYFRPNAYRQITAAQTLWFSKPWSILVSPTQKRTEGRSPVWGSELTSKRRRTKRGDPSETAVG
jgi:hypothetical protein